MSARIAKIWSYLSSLLVCLIVLLAVLLAGVRVVGLTPYAILSGSMEPKYPVGSLIYVRHVDPLSVVEGDVITFVLNEQLQTATHRVVKVDAATQQFTTKGDANNSIDGTPVHFNNLLGKAVFALPWLGYFSNWVSRPPGLYIGLALVALLILLMLLPELLNKDTNEKDKHSRQTKTMDKAQGA